MRLEIPLSCRGQGRQDDCFLLTVKRDKAAAKRFFGKAMEIPLVVRQIKYLNHIVEQDHHAVKRITKPMLAFTSFRSAKSILAGIELMIEGADNLSFADQFYALAGKIRSV